MMVVGSVGVGSSVSVRVVNCRGHDGTLNVKLGLGLGVEGFLGELLLLHGGLKNRKDYFYFVQNVSFDSK